MKILHHFNSFCGAELSNDINEAIAEIEELMKPKNCEGCRYENEDASSLPCVACVRNVDTDYYEPKEVLDDTK